MQANRDLLVFVRSSVKNRFYFATTAEQNLDVVPCGSWGRKTTGKIIGELKYIMMVMLLAQYKSDISSWQ